MITLGELKKGDRFLFVDKFNKTDKRRDEYTGYVMAEVEEDENLVPCKFTKVIYNAEGRIVFNDDEKICRAGFLHRLNPVKRLNDGEQLK